MLLTTEQLDLSLKSPFSNIRDIPKWEFESSFRINKMNKNQGISNITSVTFVQSADARVPFPRRNMLFDKIDPIVSEGS